MRLSSLKLTHFLLAEQVDVAFAEGFTVLTGETGAGKSLLMQGLSAALGGRVDASLVRVGCDKADVTAVFDAPFAPALLQWLDEKEIEEDAVLILRRVISAEGRSKAFINGVSVTVADLKQVGDMLVQLHSQHSQQALLDETYALHWLDEAGQLTTARTQVAEHFAAWQRVQSMVNKALAQGEAARMRQHALSSYVEEFEPLAALDYADLEAEYDALSHFEQLMQRAAELSAGVDTEDSSMLSAVGALAKRAESETRAPVFAQVAEQLYSAHAALQEVHALLHDYMESQTFDPARYEWLNQQLAEFHRMARKHRVEPHALAALYATWQNELDALLLEADSDALEKAAAEAKATYLQAAQQLENARQAVMPTLIHELTQQARQLAMPEAQFQFQVTALAQPCSTGLNDYQLLFTANKGMPMALLAKAASGGELSRIALVMHHLVAKQSAQHKVLVFDEIDVGISGGTAEVVGRLLAEQAQHSQIIAITHQPQVAARGDSHLLAEKYQTEPAHSQIKRLSEDERIVALAKMSGGVEITDETLAHARRLRQG